jgi:hypothetical protein
LCVQAPPLSAMLEAFTILHLLHAIAPASESKPSAAAAGAQLRTLARFASYSLTSHGNRMAALPLTPMYANLLLHAAGAGVGADACGVVACLSVDNIWVNAGRERRGALDSARKKFASAEGDHITLLNVFRAFERVVSAAAREEGEAATRLRMPAEAAAAVAVPRIVQYESDDEGTSSERLQGHADESGLQEWAVRSASSGSAHREQPSGEAAAIVSISAGSCAAAIRRATEKVASTAAIGHIQKGGGPKQLTNRGGNTDERGQRAKGSLLRAITGRALHWCVEHFVSMRSLRRAVAIRDQLADICAASGIDLSVRSAAASDPTAAGLRKALAIGCWLQSAVRQPIEPGSGGRPSYRLAGYAAVTGGSAAAPANVHVHPGSVLVLVHSYVRNKQAAVAAARAAASGHSRATAASEDDAATLALLGLGYPEAVVYGEVVYTGRAYMRQVTRVEPAWLAEACPSAFLHVV